MSKFLGNKKVEFKRGRGPDKKKRKRRSDAGAAKKTAAKVAGGAVLLGAGALALKKGKGGAKLKSVGQKLVKGRGGPGQKALPAKSSAKRPDIVTPAPKNRIDVVQGIDGVPNRGNLKRAEPMGRTDVRRRATQAVRKELTKRKNRNKNKKLRDGN